MNFFCKAKLTLAMITMGALSSTAAIAGEATAAASSGGYSMDIWASPQTVYTPRGGVGSTNIHWTWNRVAGAPPYGCLYVQNHDTGKWTVVQCEHPRNWYTTYIPWIVGGRNTYFRIAVQFDTVTHDQPAFIEYSPSGNTILSVVGVEQ